ncbi:hypothetical protein [Streptomyces sp. NPDC046939]|uniref:hypothetical protein n=1 Tax=Streptomyces sp. NPDC046939 TaxID=3155376 RepID=UPI003402BD4A
MTDPKPGNPNVKEQYAAQVAADLERNAKEQEEIGTELENLQAKLRVLQEDQAILVSMQQALGTKEGAAAAARSQRRGSAPAAGAKSGSPKRKQPRAAKATTAKATSAKAPSTKAPSSKATSAARPARKASASAQPTLVNLVQEYLKQQTEPRSAAELADALAAAHPDRTFKKPVVRTTVEGLVAKGLAQRSKQGSSVFYSTPEQAKSPEPAAE